MTLSQDVTSPAQAKKYLEEGEFEAGSMAPKIEAAIDFIGESAIRRTVVTRLDSESPDITTANGTLIRK